ncbi:hypothetical protein TNCV_1836591 [Trichonephila clavipes]|nr:hypothetical protein TNCV_1836591 [Trichonephila clavipes]
MQTSRVQVSVFASTCSETSEGMGQLGPGPGPRLILDSALWYWARTRDMPETIRYLDHYGGYDPRLETEWARVQVPNKAWMYLREKEVGLSPEMESSAPLLFYAGIIV